MIRQTLVILIVGAVALGASGCIFKVDDEPPPPQDLGAYPKDLSHPDSLLKQLSTAYKRRQVEYYGELLDPDFLFIFNESDVTPEIPNGTWNRDEDSTGTARIFDSSEVVEIRINLTAFPPETGLTSNNIEAQRVRVSALLDVDIDGGETTLRVNNESQDFYFRQGSEEEGTDPDRWYLIEWVDLGGTGGGNAPKGRTDLLRSDYPVARFETMGGIRSHFTGK